MVRGLGEAPGGVGCCCGRDWRHESQYSSSGTAVAAVRRGKKRRSTVEHTLHALPRASPLFIFVDFPLAQGELTADARGLVEAVDRV